jgi:predicted Zn-dependent protease
MRTLLLFRAFVTKITQLRLERNYPEAVRLLQARAAQLQFGSEIEKGLIQWRLAVAQRLAGDIAGAKVTAEQARNTLEAVRKNQPDNAIIAALLSRAYAALGDKNSALNEAEHAIALVPSAKDSVSGPVYEENLALVEVMVGETSQAISTIARLLQTPYRSFQLYSQTTPVTPALLRVDPTWDPLRADPAFQKLCEEKQQ